MLLIVDDDPDLRSGVARYLRANGFEMVEAESGAQAAAVLERSVPDAVILDLTLPDTSGLEVLERIRERSPSTPVVMLTGNASIDAAVDSIKRGAENFLTKPVDMSALLVVLERALANRAHRMKALAAPRSDGAPNPFLGKSEVIRRLQQDAKRLLTTDRPVLLLGETGTGKGVLARWLHAQSPRAKEAFVDLNCAGLSRELLETELFGHEAGAFTGATRRKAGLLEEAHKGAVFLDELAEMDLTVQAKLLKALEERKIRRVGDTRDRQVDFRLIAATHRDLAAAVREGRFREDLYFRVSTFPLNVPSLRERVLDLPEIASVLLGAFGAEIGRPRLRLHQGAIEALQARAWRGNIRELRNVLERAALFADGDELRAELFPAEPTAGAGPARAADGPSEDSLTLEEVEKRHVLRVLRAERNRIQPAARRLGIARSSLYEKLRRWGHVVTESEQASGDES